MEVQVREEGSETGKGKKEPSNGMPVNRLPFLETGAQFCQNLVNYYSKRLTEEQEH